MHYVLGVLLALPSIALAAPTLTTSGTCPGTVDIEIGALTAGGGYAMLVGADVGSATIGYGPCAGTASGLSDARVALTRSDRDGDGAASFSPSLPSDLGGTRIQILDMATCEMSEAMRVCTPEAEGTLYAAASSGSFGTTAFYSIDLGSGAVSFVGDPGVGITGLASVDGVLYGIQDASGSGIYSIDPATGAATLEAAAEDEYYDYYYGYYGCSVYGEAFIGAIDGQIVAGDYPNCAGTYTPGGTFVNDRPIENSFAAAYGMSLVQTSEGSYFVGYNSLATYEPATGEQGPGIDFTGDYAGSSNGGGAAVVDDVIYTTLSFGDETALFRLDPATGALSDTGIRIPEPDIDALGSLSDAAPEPPGALVGSYRISDGPAWGDDPPTYNCLEGCAVVFGGTADDYQCSTDGAVVDNQAYVDGWGDDTYCITPVAEDYKLGENYNCGGMGCSYSAYVSDHGCVSTNYCYTR